MQEIKEQIEDYQKPQHTIQALKNLETQNLFKNSLLIEISDMLTNIEMPNNGINEVFEYLKIQINSTVQSTADIQDIHCTVDLVCDVIEQVCKD